MSWHCDTRQSLHLSALVCACVCLTAAISPILIWSISRAPLPGLRIVPHIQLALIETAVRHHDMPIRIRVTAPLPPVPDGPVTQPYLSVRPSAHRAPMSWHRINPESVYVGGRTVGAPATFFCVFIFWAALEWEVLVTLERLVNHYVIVSAADAQSGSRLGQLNSSPQSFYRITVALVFCKDYVLGEKR